MMIGCHSVSAIGAGVCVASEFLRLRTCDWSVLKFRASTDFDLFTTNDGICTSVSCSCGLVGVMNCCDALCLFLVLHILPSAWQPDTRRVVTTWIEVRLAAFMLFCSVCNRCALFSGIYSLTDHRGT